MMKIKKFISQSGKDNSTNPDLSTDKNIQMCKDIVISTKYVTLFWYWFRKDYIKILEASKIKNKTWA